MVFETSWYALQQNENTAKQNARIFCDIVAMGILEEPTGRLIHYFTMNQIISKILPGGIYLIIHIVNNLEAVGRNKLFILGPVLENIITFSTVYCNWKIVIIDSIGEVV